MNHFSQQILVEHRIAEFQATAARERMSRLAHARRRTGRSGRQGARQLLAGLAATLHR